MTDLSLRAGGLLNSSSGQWIIQFESGSHYILTRVRFVYMFYGLFMYGYQGQYSVNPSPLTIAPYWGLVVSFLDPRFADVNKIDMMLQVSSLLYIISGAIAAVLYGNIGLKGMAWTA
jgi:hypothetical protein